jgi:hypothetical protein
MGWGCPGIYTLDCYCDRGDWSVKPHVWAEFPHQYTAELGTTCRKAARKDGWRLDYRNDLFLCPKCNPYSKKYQLHTLLRLQTKRNARSMK